MNKSYHRNNDTVVALDIGTTKICAVVGRKNEFGLIEVMGYGKVPSVGVRRGVVANIDKTVQAISDAVDAAEKMANIEIHEVHVGIAGQHIKSLQHQGILTLADADKEITHDDIELLNNDMRKLALPPGDTILHIIPQEYKVDDEEGIIDPIGMCGHRLNGNFHVITGQQTAYNNIKKCVEKAGLKVSALTLEPIASAASVLSDQEKEAGVALIDIGGGTTDITIFQEGIIRHTAVVPFGGDVITKDIKDGCTVMHDQAEKLKVRFGSAMAGEVVDNRIITIPGLKGRDPKEISERNLSKIIQARLEEVFDFVHFEIQRSGFDNKLIGGLVLTGGGALLKNIEHVAALQTGLEARLGLPTEHLAAGYRDEISSPIFATGIGLLIHGIETMKSSPVRILATDDDETDETTKSTVDSTVGTPGQGSKWLETIFKTTKGFFEPQIDNEL